MSTLRVKAGTFSDGGHRIVAVKAGASADPVPTDTSQIIFNSDWGEMLPTTAALIGSSTISASSSWQTINFPSLGYVPYVLLAFSPVSYSSYDTSHGLAFGNEGNWFTSVNMFAGGAPGTPLAAGYGLLFYQIGDGALKIAFNPPGSPSTGYSGFPTTIQIAWCVVRASTVAPNLSASRAGTNWMRWTNAGPIIAKPGKDVSSANVDDFLFNPAAGLLNTQPLYSGSVSSLPYVGPLPNNNNNGVVWTTTIAHGLGYIPLFFAMQNLSAGANPTATIMMTTNDLIIYQSTPYNVAHDPSSISPVNYAVMRQRWV